jgi:hypothetical protein
MGKILIWLGLITLENRIDKLSKMSSWTFIAFVNQELWSILSTGSIALDWPKLVVGGLVRAGGRILPSLHVFS